MINNPYDIITSNNHASSILLIIFGGFSILLLLFLYLRKKKSLENETENISLSIIGKLITLLFSSGFIICFIYILIYLFNYYSELGSLLLISLKLFIIIGIITILFKYIGLLDTNYVSWPKLLIKIITYIPCLFMMLIDYVKNQYNITTKPIIILFIIEIVVIGLYLLLPFITEKLMYHNTSQLINEPVNLNIQKKLGTFQDVNYIASTGTEYDTFNYNYAISSWFYINSNPPETNSYYDKYTSILNIGDKPDIQFNVLKNKLRIKLITQNNTEQIIYETINFTLQKWNNIIINYDGSTFDIFINNELVSSTDGIIPYNSNTLITSGTEEGLYGGICNVKYFRNNISRSKINWLYNSIKSLNPPLI
jgi:cbb3-type cytochrome oxidase subunit 3